uniref:uncharacterized protein LOC120345983 n=1 Tax=Styela clava TaxID=7725 RepID=UPI001939A5F6|nr:uncharacterized protein LOC120345983 [Styela clava]
MLIMQISNFYTNTWTLLPKSKLPMKNQGNCIQQRLFLWSIVVIIFTWHTTSARLDYEHRRTINELEDIFEILRKNQASTTVREGSKWSDAVDAWVTETQGKSITGKYGSTNERNQKISVTRESIWKVWNSLRTGTRELVIKKLYPLLIPQDSSEELNWRLHCADAYKLCMADTNCYWKYKNFLSSCTDKDLSILNTEDEESDEFFPSDALETKRTRRRLIPDRKRHHNSRRRSVKRDVYEVERKMRSEARVTRRRKRTQRQKSVFWMGQYFLSEKYTDPYSVLRYFSMASRSSKCSTKCVHSLMMLNETVYGALLAHCDCRAQTMPSAYQVSGSVLQKNQIDSTDGSQISQEKYLQDWENTCFIHQRSAQTCRPRTFRRTSGIIGCTEARQRCEKNSICRIAQQNFLSKCSQVINGIHCSSSCKESVRRLRQATSHYDTCVCDTSEGPTCQQIRSNVVHLCDIPLGDNTKDFQDQSTKQNLKVDKNPTLTDQKTSAQIYSQNPRKFDDNSTNVLNRSNESRKTPNSSAASFFISQYHFIILQFFAVIISVLFTE